MNPFHKPIHLKDTNEPTGTGWLPPTPDLRDYTKHNVNIEPFNLELGIRNSNKKSPTAVDLRKWCSPVENQGTIGSCTAHAAAGIVEYYEKRAFNKHIEVSRLFLYKTTRNLMQVRGDVGGWLRCTMGALVLCGVPAEKYWPYKVADYDKEPDAFVYSLADNYETLKYFCHDPLSYAKASESKAWTIRQSVLDSVKKYLEAGIPSMFGFWGFPSFESSDVKGGIPYPSEGEYAEWGHAIMAVGYDDTKKITNTKSNKQTTGALLIRNSWGKEWGDKGYGWLPYEYVLNNLALDFWSLLGMEWVETGEFGI
jgi:C1A family cysteine protease